MTSTAIVWFRQDLRLYDNPAFAQACSHHDVVIPVYILDEIYELIGGAQRWWLHHSLESLDKGLKKLGLNLCLRQGKALDVLKQLVEDYQIGSIYWNRCYDPVSIERDTVINKVFQTGVKYTINLSNLQGCVLLIPYFIWLLFAAYFNTVIWIFNAS